MMQTPNPQRRDSGWIIRIVLIAAIGVFLFIVVVGVLIAWRQIAGVGSPAAPPTVLAVPTRMTPDSPIATVAVDLLATPTGATVATVTLAAAPAPTTEPTATPPLVIPPDLPAGSVGATRVDSPFTIDGDLSGWADIPSYPSLFRAYTAPTWDGSDDVSAFWRLAYDRDNLYIGVVVTDDVHVQTQSGNLTFRGDSLEMQIDTDRAGDYGPGLNTDDYQLVLSPGDFVTLPASAFRFRASATGQSQDAPGHAIQVRARQTDDGYTLEAAIPWIDLGIRPQPGDQIGLALNINDNDTPGTARQEMMKSSIATRTFSDPTTWGTLVLGE